MEQKPWYQKEKLDPVFPFRLWETSMRGFKLHWHELLEIAYVRKGGLVISVEGLEYEATQGDLVIINSGSVHGYSRSGANTSIVLVQFGLELFDQSLIDLRDRMFQRLVFERKTIVTTEEDGEIHSLLEGLVLDMRREFSDKTEGYRLAIKACLYDLALILLRRVPARQFSPAELNKRRHRNEILERIFSFVHSRFSQPITLAEAAASANLSKFYFTRFFKEQTGQNFHTYLARVRVSHAEELLAGSDVSITEIAYTSGFASLKTFNRLFRTYTGTSPTQYRRGSES
ncbi:MAG: AraC family transcriptional regulator [Treponemataceae bacterium]